MGLHGSSGIVSLVVSDHVSLTISLSVKCYKTAGAAPHSDDGDKETQGFFKAN